MKMPSPATCMAVALRRPAPSALMMAMASSLTSSAASSKSNGGNRQQMMESGLSRILTDEQRSLFHQVNQLSAMTRSLARQVGNVAIKEDSLLADITRIQTQKLPRQQTSKDQEQKTNESTDVSAPPSLFTVVFAGEFNSGKSTLINALLGNELLDTGVLPTTDAITVVMANGDDADPNDDEVTSPLIESGSFASDDSAVPVHTQLLLLSASDFPILSDLCLIDTPGTNAILSLQHTSSTLRILHDADLIVFVTSADRPFSESERQLLQTSIKLYRKRVVLVINKMDILERQKGEDHGESTKKRVEEYVVEHASDLLGARPVVIPLSARDALSMKLLYNSHRTSNDGPGSAEYQPSLWTRSNFGALEHFLSTTLTASSKVKTKLLNPIGVTEGILFDCQTEIKRRQEELDVDVMTLRLLRSQTEAWERELKIDVIDQCLSNVKKVVAHRAEAATRVIGDLSYFDQWKLGAGLGRSIFDQAWERSSRRCRGVPFALQTKDSNTHNILENELLSILNECLETLLLRAQTQGNASLEYLGKRPAIVGSGSMGRRMVGNVRTPSYQRLVFIKSSITDVIQSSTSKLPSDVHSTDKVYKSLRRTALLSSVLLGSSAMIATLSALDCLDTANGLVSSLTLAALGGISLPLGNRYLAVSFQREWMEHTEQLETALDNLFKDVFHEIKSELSESIAPYSRYVSSEVNWLKDLGDKLDSGISIAHNLRSKINKACD
ncbi:hypothetical protein ACHAW5_009854 [Stephanodiscus triporus]|uniref:Dynamin N-terminal domain-containing protein n=1 Tax=Stephanodiscus triporus TaxID=2934178 RepID=A0ABD3QJL9_9STRA